MRQEGQASLTPPITEIATWLTFVRPDLKLRPLAEGGGARRGELQ